MAEHSRASHGGFQSPAQNMKWAMIGIIATRITPCAPESQMSMRLSRMIFSLSGTGR